MTLFANILLGIGGALSKVGQALHTAKKGKEALKITQQYEESKKKFSKEMLQELDETAKKVLSPAVGVWCN